MKKWLKSEDYESLNSARIYCLRKTWSTSAAGKKKKKLKTCYNVKRGCGRGLVSKPHLNACSAICLICLSPAATIN